MDSSINPSIIRKYPVTDETFVRLSASISVYQSANEVVCKPMKMADFGLRITIFLLRMQHLEAGKRILFA